MIFSYSMFKTLKAREAQGDCFDQETFKELPLLWCAVSEGLFGAFPTWSRWVNQYNDQTEFED